MSGERFRPEDERRAALRLARRESAEELLAYVRFLARQSNSQIITAERLALIRIGVDGSILDQAAPSTARLGGQ